jgi:hypothetical protein
MAVAVGIEPATFRFSGGSPPEQVPFALVSVLRAGTFGPSGAAGLKVWPDFGRMDPSPTRPLGYERTGRGFPQQRSVSRSQVSRVSPSNLSPDVALVHIGFIMFCCQIRSQHPDRGGDLRRSKGTHAPAESVTDSRLTVFAGASAQRRETPEG